MFNFVNSPILNKFLNLGKLRIHHSKSIYTKTPPLTVKSNRAKLIFDEQLKKMRHCQDTSSKFKFAYNIIEQIFYDEELCFNSPLVTGINKELIEYNLEGGRHKRVKIFLDAYENLATKEMLSEEHRLRAYVMACLNQLSLSALMMMDDTIDDSKMRRNKPTWHRKAGRFIFNDIFLLSNGVFVVLRNLFETEPYFAQCLNVFYEIYWWGGCSVWLDISTLDILGRNMQYCNWDVHRTINAIQIGCTCFQAPLFTALHMVEQDFENIKNDLIKICGLLGYIGKDQNDYCDRYSKTQGKTPDEDIRLGKLTWFILTALERSNTEQKTILRKCYGQDDPHCMNAVIDIYEQLQLRDQFFKYQRELIDFTTKQIGKVPDEKIQKIH